MRQRRRAQEGYSRLGASSLVALVILLLPLSARPQQEESPAVGASSGEACVILLHGLGRTYRSMNHMARALWSAGYRVVNQDYPSREETVEALAMSSVPAALARCRSKTAGAIHFVTHSMGGIVLRYYLSQQRPPELGRAVMLAPPNQGSEVADVLKDLAPYEWFNGPAGQQLGTGPDSLPNRLGPVDFPVGIIAGNAPHVVDQLLTDVFPGENDGKVSVERTKVEGMSDFLVVPYDHTFIMDEPEVIRQTLKFIAEGTFDHSAVGAGDEGICSGCEVGSP